MDKPPYKDVMGRWRTHSLFRENYLPQEEYPAMFTLQEDDFVDNDGKRFYSMRKMFLSYNDPTGYQFAKDILGSYEHWKRLQKAPWFRQHLAEWLTELEVKLLSLGIKKINEIASGDSGQSFAAARYLSEKGWEPKKGRPKKADVEHQAKLQAGVEASVEEDLVRLSLVKG